MNNYNKEKLISWNNNEIFNYIFHLLIEYLWILLILIQIYIVYIYLNWKKRNKDIITDKLKINNTIKCLDGNLLQSQQNIQMIQRENTLFRNEFDMLLKLNKLRDYCNQFFWIDGFSEYPFSNNGSYHLGTNSYPIYDYIEYNKLQLKLPYEINQYKLGKYKKEYDDIITFKNNHNINETEMYIYDKIAKRINKYSLSAIIGHALYEFIYLSEDKCNNNPIIKKLKDDDMIVNRKFNNFINYDYYNKLLYDYNDNDYNQYIKKEEYFIFTNKYNKKKLFLIETGFIMLHFNIVTKNKVFINNNKIYARHSIACQLPELNDECIITKKMLDRVWEHTMCDE